MSKEDGNILNARFEARDVSRIRYCMYCGGDYHLKRIHFIDSILIECGHCNGGMVLDKEKGV